MFGDKLKQFGNLSNIIGSDRNFRNIKRFYKPHNKIYQAESQFLGKIFTMRLVKFTKCIIKKRLNTAVRIYVR